MGSLLSLFTFCCGIGIVIFDIIYHRIPNRLLLLLLLSDGVFALVSSRALSWLELLFAPLFIALFYLVMNLLFARITGIPDAIGIGDIKYTMVSIVHLGIVTSIDLVRIAEFLAFCWAIASLYALVAKVFTGAERIPLAPAIFIALNIAQNI